MGTPEDLAGAVDCLQPTQGSDVSERLLSAKQVAERLGISPLTVAEMMRDGRLPAVRLGRLRRVRESDLDEYIAALPVMTPRPRKTVKAPTGKGGAPSEGQAMTDAAP